MPHEAHMRCGSTDKMPPQAWSRAPSRTSPERDIPKEPIMPRNAIRYKEVMVAPGSQLYDLIQSKDKDDAKKAAELYDDVMKKFRKEYP